MMKHKTLRTGNVNKRKWLKEGHVGADVREEELQELGNDDKIVSSRTASQPPTSTTLPGTIQPAGIGNKLSDLSKCKSFEAFI
jgi:hypothetical protein